MFISVILDNNVVKKKKIDKINISDKYLTLIFSHKSHFTFSLLSELFFSFQIELSLFIFFCSVIVKLIYELALGEMYTFIVGF